MTSLWKKIICVCKIKFPTKRIFRIFPMWRIDGMAPFCNLFMERPSYYQKYIIIVIDNILSDIQQAPTPWIPATESHKHSSDNRCKWQPEQRTFDVKRQLRPYCWGNALYSCSVNWHPAFPIEPAPCLTPAFMPARASLEANPFMAVYKFHRVRSPILAVVPVTTPMSPDLLV